MDRGNKRILKGNTSLGKPQMNSPQKGSSRARELHMARRDLSRFNESTRAAETVKSKAESELTDAKKTVKDLTARIEELNSRLRRRAEDMEKLKKGKTGNSDGYSEVIRELGEARRELSELRRDIEIVLEEKRRAEEETSASGSRMESSSSMIEGLKKEIEELNEELVLVELARIEAVKERRAIEAQRAEQAKKHKVLMEKMREAINGLAEQIGRTKELETELAATDFDTKMLGSELKQARQMDSSVQRNPISKESNELDSITEELNSAKKQLASVQEESFKCMSSMDVIRKELNRVLEEKARCKKRERKMELTIENLNSKLLRAKAKLEAASASEEKTDSMASNLSLTLEQLKTGAEAAERERVAAIEETAKIKEEIQKTNSETDLAEDKLQAAIQEVKNLKSSEGVALENLRAVIEKTIRNRASMKSSKIVISKFEYEYLKGHAAMAEEIADKKVAAAQAWVDALRDSEKEILMRTVMIEEEAKELKAEEDRSLSATTMVERELQKLENSRPSSNLQRRSLTISGKVAPLRRSSYGRSASPAFMLPRRSTSFTLTGRRKVLPTITKFFGGKGTEDNM